MQSSLLETPFDVDAMPNALLTPGDDGSPARSLGEFLFPEPAPRSVGKILLWWERRRLFYNVAVGVAGLATLGVFTTMATIGTRGLFVPWQPAVAFGVLANVCYTLGGAIEIAALKIWGRSMLPIGPALYRMGLTFSVGLALLPGLVATVVGVLWVVFNLRV